MSYKIKDNRLPEVIAKIQRAELIALTKMALYVHARASENCKVDTGRLRASISYSVNSGTIYPHKTYPKENSKDEDVQIGGEKGFAIVGTNVEYAKFLEYGTSKMGKRPFLRPAVDDNLATIKRIGRNEFAKGILK